jgi:hypothetical protein
MATIIGVQYVRQYVTYHMMRLGIYVSKNHLPKERRVSAVSDPISLEIFPDNMFEAVS